MSLLSIEHLSLAFGSSPVIQDISFTIAKGEMLALVGESGSGKSLTALSCMGLQPAQSKLTGSIRFENQELVGMPDAKLRHLRGKDISMIFQEPMTALNPLHTIGKQISEMFKGKASTSQSSQARIIDLLDQVGLSHFRNRLNAYPHELSGGERQRVMIAMAIANHPKLLIADEPTTAVDVTIQAKILTLLKELQHSLGMSMLFITHDLTLVRAVAERVAVMSQGVLVEQGSVAELFNAPRHAYTKHLLASMPRGEAKTPVSQGEAVMACEQLKVYFPIKKGLLRRTVSFNKAVDGVTLSIPRGGTLGIVGESGSGKTTLGFALLRLLKSEGRIVFLGQDIQGLSRQSLRPLRKQMQPVFQDPYSSLNPRMSVRQIIEEGLLVHFPNKTASERATDIHNMLSEVGLDPAMADRFPHEFSGGQRQRISIARAMIVRPEFVVLDEPTSALDVSVQAQIIELLNDLQGKYGLAMLFISHDLRVVRALAPQLVVMHGGKIVEHGATADIFSHPKHNYTKTLIKSAFFSEPTLSS